MAGTEFLGSCACLASRRFMRSDYVYKLEARPRQYSEYRIRNQESMYRSPHVRFLTLVLNKLDMVFCRNPRHTYSAVFHSTAGP